MTTYYVDSDLDSNSGDGSSGDPWGDLNYAISEMDSAGWSDGDIIAGKGEEDCSAASVDVGTLASTISKRITFQQWEGATQWYWNGGGSQTILNFGSTPTGMMFHGIEMGNTGSSRIVNAFNASSFNAFCDCYFHDSTHASPVAIYCRGAVQGCRFEDLNTALIYGYVGFLNNWVKVASGATDYATILQNPGCRVIGNIFHVPNTCPGIRVHYPQSGGIIAHNTIVSDTGNANDGIYLTHTQGFNLAEVTANLIVGFSGSGGKGIDASNSTVAGFHISGNAFYDCDTDLDEYASGGLYFQNESLGGDPIARSGANTFANRKTYFAPNDVGNIRAGLVDQWSIGAVQHEGSGGGGSTLIVVDD